jgi:hypothetical protein
MSGDFMSSFSVTRRALSFGARDSVTGWYAPVYTDTTIKGSMQPQGSSVNTLPVGGYARYPHTFFTEYVVHEGDVIKDADLDIYILNTVVKWSYGDKFSHYVCEAVKQEFDLRDASSGTWHVDSDALKTDPRSRTKTYLDTYLTPGNIAGDYITCFDGADYPIKYLFNAVLGVDTDLVMSIGEETSTSEDTIYDVPYKDTISVPITLSAVNKTGYTATNLIEQAEKEIEKVLTDHPLSFGNVSKRSLVSSKPNRVDLGNGSYLWQKVVTIKYERSNDDHVPTVPYLTYSTIAGGPYTYILPNVIQYSMPNSNNDFFDAMPSRLGNYPQLLGSESLEIQLTCDLDMEHTNLTWKRSQTGAKTDAVNFQVFLDIMHSAAQSQPYLILTLDWGSFKARLTNIKQDADGQNNLITLTFKEYNDTSANTNYKTRWGIT